jgi:hypothetical protein
MKRGALDGVDQFFFSRYQDASNISYFRWSDTNILRFYDYSGGVLRTNRETNAVFRDPSAWYHVVLVYDSNNATAASRARIYVNNVEQTYAFSTNPNSGQTSIINASGSHQIGSYNSTNYLDGYLAEVNFIDGQALAPSAFGYTDNLTNQWVPKKYTGTYGTNGFYLPFNYNTPARTYSATFNGSSQYLLTATNAGLSLGTSDFTIEYWMNTTVAQNGATLCCAGTGTVSYDGLFGYTTSGSLVTYLSSSGGAWDIASNRTIISSIVTGRWYHIAFTRSGSTWRVFVDGTQVDTFTSSASLYQSGNQFSLARAQGTGYFNGLLSNVRVIKGTALYTANFNPPIAPLTAVTNTQLLTIQDSTIIDNSTNALTFTNTGSVTTTLAFPYTYAIAADRSGNGNQWMTNNIIISPSPSSATTTHESMFDSPTAYDDGSTYYNRGNYATLNPLDKWSASGTTSNANLYTNGSGVIRSTLGMTTGQWYWEVIPQSTLCIFGIATAAATMNQYIGQNAFGWGYYANGNKYTNGSLSAYGATFTTNDIIGVAFDATNGSLTFFKNGASQGVAFTGLTSGGPYFAAFSDNGSTAQPNAVNFGQMPFSYTPPAGFKALNTFNLPNPSLPLV